MSLPYDPYLPMAPQVTEWTCSACSLDWALASLGARPSDRPTTVFEIGYPDNINSVYGLMDARGIALAEVLERYGFTVGRAEAASYDQAVELAGYAPILAGGASWYHWCTLIYPWTDPELYRIANSAPGYMGVTDQLTRDDWARLGPFNLVYPTGRTA